MALIDEIYEVSFKYPSRMPDYVSLYIPEYDYIDAGQSEIYPVFFGMEGSAFSEDDWRYIYTDDFAELCVYKYVNRVTLKYFNIKSGTLKVEKTYKNDAEIIAAASGFIEERLLPMTYDGVYVERNGSVASITFLDSISGLQNYAHPVTVTVDAHGNIIGLDYFRLTYEKIATVRIMTMKEAYYSLPVSEEMAAGGVRTDLKKCSLVYFFEDSILQPAYRFEGETVIEGGGEAEPFIHFVKAALYR